MSKFSVLAIGRALISALEELHNMGYTHNDIKPDNIMIGYNPQLVKETSWNVFKNTTLHLIDFGLADKFSNQKMLNSHFRGNFMFSSISQMEF